MLGYVIFVVNLIVTAVRSVAVRLIGMQQSQCVISVGGLNNDEVIYLFKE